MKFTLIAILLAFPLLGLAEVVVREEPLTWGKSARLSGGQMYQNLCAACHDADGSGNGMASAALGIGAPDLTRIAVRNGGVFPHKGVERSIANSADTGIHGNRSMPYWEQQFMFVRIGWTSFQREAYARNRIHELARHLETLQVYN